MIRYVLILSLLFTALSAVETGFSKDYYEIEDTETKKTAFVNTLLPKIKKVEKQILEDRAFIQKFFHKYIFTYSLKSRLNLMRLIKISKKYKIKQIYNESEYLRKVDIIPVSLVLAQSAVESSWGSSRFAKEGNNLFGEWTWGKKGIVPENREEGARHKLRIFKSLDDSIARYMLNLNRHSSYTEFRRLRARYRALNENFTGVDACPTMINYSQMREEYTKLLEEVIVSNDFMGYEI